MKLLKKEKKRDTKPYKIAFSYSPKLSKNREGHRFQSEDAYRGASNKNRSARSACSLQPGFPSLLNRYGSLERLTKLQNARHRTRVKHVCCSPFQGTTAKHTI